MRGLSESEESQYEQDDNDGADDVDDLVHELFLGLDGFGDRLSEPGDSPLSVCVAGLPVGAAPHREFRGSFELPVHRIGACGAQTPAWPHADRRAGGAASRGRVLFGSRQTLGLGPV